MDKCRSCSSKNIHSIIPLGYLPLANALLKSADVTGEVRHNLEVMLCTDCGLAQLKDLIDPKDLFSDYVYFSSNSDTMLSSAKSLVETIVPTLKDDALVVEIASNDGYLLKNYVADDIDVLGIDPAQNIVKQANALGIKTLCDFFSNSLAANLKSEGTQADIIHANNVMAHVPDINDFIKGIKTLLKTDGKAIIEVPYFLDLVAKLEFDTIYHEHVYYFALKPLVQAFERHDMKIFDIEKLSIHGGTLRLFVGHKDQHTVSALVEDMLEAEAASCLFDVKTFTNFMAKLDVLKSHLKETLKTFKNQGKNIVAYGASAKGTTLLNYFNIGEELDFVVDRSTAKQGLYTPGTGLPIKKPECLNNAENTYALLLAWNFATEIIEQQSKFIKSGGKFIIPLPKVEVRP